MNSSNQNHNFSFISLLFILFPFAFIVNVGAATVEKFQKTQSDKFEGCNWNITYRGKVYDLTPLTKVSLAKPIDTDIRYVIEKVPKAKEHFDQISIENGNARGHTFLASFFASTFFVTRILESRQNAPDAKESLNILSLISGMLFVKAGYESWRAIRNSENELVKSINAFNAESPYPIEAYESQSQIPLREFNTQETYDAEEK